MQTTLLRKENESIEVEGFTVTITRIGAGHVMLKSVYSDTGVPRASSMVPYGYPFRLTSNCLIKFNYCPPEHVKLHIATDDGVTVIPGVRHAA
ncbi:MAG: hypothetical protein SV201_05805 [Pseudomonadota bacterium]|nr:hypothetical protein [Pseudomonadota bacterium]